MTANPTPQGSLAPIYDVPEDRDSDLPKAVRYWVLNPDRRPGQDELVAAITNAHAAFRKYERRLMVVMAPIAAVTVMFTILSALNEGTLRALACVLFGTVGLVAVHAWHPPKVRATAEQDVARPIYRHGAFQLRVAQVATLTKEGFGSPAHRALWAGLVARDDADALDVALLRAVRADPSVTRAARRRSKTLRGVQLEEYRTFEEQIAHAQIDPDATAKLRAVLDHVGDPDAR